MYIELPYGLNSSPITFVKPSDRWYLENFSIADETYTFVNRQVITKVTIPGLNVYGIF